MIERGLDILSRFQFKRKAHWFRDLREVKRGAGSPRKSARGGESRRGAFTGVKALTRVYLAFKIRKLIENKTIS